MLEPPARASFFAVRKTCCRVLCPSRRKCPGHGNDEQWYGRLKTVFCDVGKQRLQLISRMGGFDVVRDELGDSTWSGRCSGVYLSPSTAFKNSFLLNLGSKSFLCNRIEGHKIIAATRHLDLHVRSRPSQKRTTPQPQKWVRFRGPKTGPQTAACGESCELIRKRRSLHKQSEIVSKIGSIWRPHSWGRQVFYILARIRRRDLELPSNKLQTWTSPLHGSHAGSTGFDRSLKARATSLRSTRQEPLAPPRPLLPVPVFCFDFGSVFRTSPRIITLSIRCSRLRYMSEESALIPARN